MHYALVLIPSIVFRWKRYRFFYPFKHIRNRKIFNKILFRWFFKIQLTEPQVYFFSQKGAKLLHFPFEHKSPISQNEIVIPAFPNGNIYFFIACFPRSLILLIVTGGFVSVYFCGKKNEREKKEMYRITWAWVKV